jgi:hypothetical protein
MKGYPIMATDDIALPDSYRLVQPYAGESWETLREQSSEVFGADLEKGNTLIGVPFIVVRITVRPGDYTHAACGEAHPYASLDIILGDQKELDRAMLRDRITSEQFAMFEAEEHLLFNEAGTGAYRHSLAFLESQNVLILPDGPRQGTFGESRYDSLPDSWQIPQDTTSTVASPGTLAFNKQGQHIITWETRLRCPRGLRVSEYQNEYTKEGRTRYFA